MMLLTVHTGVGRNARQPTPELLAIPRAKYPETTAKLLPIAKNAPGAALGTVGPAHSREQLRNSKYLNFRPSALSPFRLQLLPKYSEWPERTAPHCQPLIRFAHSMSSNRTIRAA